MSQIFISYAREDRSRVEPLVRALEQWGWFIWWDQIADPGKLFDEVIQAQLDEAQCVIVVWTRHSVSSQWVRSEVERAANQNKLLPVLMENVQLPLGSSLYHTVDLID